MTRKEKLRRIIAALKDSTLPDILIDIIYGILFPK